jgi:hypothetical protein
MVYAAAATELVESPVAVAMASMVSVAFTVIGPEYTTEAVVGVLPLVV